MADTVHRQGGDTVAWLQPHPLQSLGHATTVAGDLPPGRADDFIARRADYFLIAVLALGMVDQAHDAQWPVLHFPQSHRSVPSGPSHYNVTGELGAGKRFVFMGE